YEVTVTDANGCQATETVTITQPSASLSISENHANVKCYGSASGSINISVSGGKAPYVYSWSNGAITQNLSALEAGDYTLTVKDANNCLAAIEITISQPLAPLTLVENHEDILCYGDATGSISLKVDGGTAPYSYLWTNNKVSKDLEGLKAGIYAVTITDAKGCTIGTQIQINQPAAPLSITETHQNVACFGTNTGSIAINVLGGTAPYAYEWSNGVEIQNLDNLFAGDYEVKVTDKNGCTVIKKIQITQPVAPLALSETHVNNGCYSDNIGKITLTATGGVTPYTYQWSNGATTKNLANLAPGVYQVVVTDKNECTQTLSVEILPIKPFIVKTEVEQIKCFGDNSGKINLQLSGGEAPYQVSWSNGTTGLSLQNLAPGTYTYTAKDALGCIQTKSVTITQPQPLSVKTEIKNTTCKYSPDGAVKLFVSGGTAPYRFIWNGTDRAQKSTLTDVNAGKYTVNVIDANNCSFGLVADVLPGNCAPTAKNDSYSTLEDTPITIKTPGIIINDSDPDDDDIRVAVHTAKDPYGDLGDIDGDKTSFKTTNGRVILNAEGSFTYIPNKNFVGTEYFIYKATDGDLRSDYARVSIEVTAVNDPPNANDDHFTINEDEKLLGSVALNDTDPENDEIKFTVVLPPTKGKLNLNKDGTFEYIPEANFHGTITFGYQVCDPDGLCDQATATIVVIPVNDAPIAMDDKFSLKRDGQIAETVATNDTEPDNDPMVFSKLTSPANGNLTFNADGTFIYKPTANFKGIDTYSYRVCDPFGLCDTATVSLVVQPVVTVNLTPSRAEIKEGDTISVTAVLTESLLEDLTVFLSYGGSAQNELDYKLSGNFISMLIPANQTETTQRIIVKALVDDVKDDNETVIGNISSTSHPTFVNIGTNSLINIRDVYPETVTNTPDENPDINPDPMFSPNGDGQGNESFIIYNITKYPNNEVVIFNRWGNEVYRTKGYDNKGNSFKGIANVGILTNTNKELVDGVYYYLIYTHENNKQKLNKGYVILKR
ncbi:Ig-like domain-containing protein, partial [Pelobium manganitolerans]|uniref:Ig-like domain-containing protein n=1 Tax=Pelobium manganitolerans TaxID=1842495 RepID=UPI003FA3DD71